MTESKSPIKPPTINLERTALINKRAELTTLKEGLNLRYNQLIGQIELIDEVLNGKLSLPDKTEHPKE